ncbi:MAG TPA: signal peptidase I [Burkholderiaceae bacterium]|jgi:signal peptidase I|nr:signal peptidase I [Burkholderiaceae bacterium]
MSVLTAVVLGALGAYVLAMIGGQVPTDFALFLFICTAVSGIYFAAELWLFAPRRREQAVRTLLEFDRRNRPAQSARPEVLAKERGALQEELSRRPWWVEYTAGFFPVIALVFVLRSFLFEPFRIPSGSMIPTLQVGDLILVNKYQYGIRLPVLNRTVVELGRPQRGDVIVFRYPHQPTQDYIKRVVGLPGDRVDYHDRRLTINGTLVTMREVAPYFDPGRLQNFPQFIETLGSVEHRVIFNDGEGASIHPALQHTNRDACVYSAGGVACTVPPESYFVMGDNRDNSEDSRFWGFVPDRNVVGRAFFIWMNFSNVGRIGRFH